MSHLDVVAVRSACADLVLEVPYLPRHDEKVVGRMVGWLPGGTMGNYACAAAKIGLKAGWIGSVADDFTSGIILDDFVRFNVDTSAVEFRPGENNSFTVVMVDPTGEKAIVVVPVLEEPKQVSEQQLEYVKRSKAVYLGPYDYEFFLNFSHDAAKAGVLVVTDVEESSIVTKDNYKELLRHVDIVIFNATGFTHVLGLDPLAGNRVELEDQLKELFELGPRLVAISLGSHGCIVADKTQIVRSPGFKVEVVDTTGAGDCFNASLTAGYLWNWSLADMAKFANAAGALAVTKYGAREALASKDQVERFLQEQGLRIG